MIPRPFSLVQGGDQWRRVAHWQTSLQPDSWAVQLAWDMEEPGAAFEAPSTPAGGLAFDPWCRLYHSLPEEGQVERVLWAARDPTEPTAEGPSPVDLFAGNGPRVLGDFHLAAGDAEAPLSDPRGLAVDDDGRLFVAEAGAKRILVYDLWEKRLLRKVELAPTGAPGPRPLDLATDGRRVWAVLDGPPGLVVLEARTGPRPLPLPGDVDAPARAAVDPDGNVYLLNAAGTESAEVVPLTDPEERFEVPFATDLEFAPEVGSRVRVDEQTGAPSAGEQTSSPTSVLVIARRAGEDFLRFSIGPEGRFLLPRLKARGYDGTGIVRTPDDRIGFWTAKGFRHAVVARSRYVRQGRVTTFRLDSGQFQTVWGRLFIDACIPRDTEVRVHCVAADEVAEDPTLVRTPPENTLDMEVHRPDLSPPMPPASFVPGPEVGLPQTLHRRESDRELPWARRGRDDPFETYEAPVRAGPGRYLWVTLELLGNTRLTPRVKSLRVEHPAHDLLRRLPQVYSRDPSIADFALRYLALFDGLLGEMDGRSGARRALLDPRSAPPELLPWLAGFLGLVLDERWPEGTRRALIEEATWLFRFRGTVPGLQRFLEIVLGRGVIIVEHFRVRGLGGSLLGGSSDLPSRAIVGAGFRVGGAVGTTEEVAVLGREGGDPFETHAHRFSVVIPVRLEREELEVVEHILELHRPAHTLYDLCLVDAGMRVGVGLYAQLTTVVGRTGGFAQLQLGGALLGRGAVLGRPGPGTRPGGSRLGADSRVG